MRDHQLPPEVRAYLKTDTTAAVTSAATSAEASAEDMAHVQEACIALQAIVPADLHQFTAWPSVDEQVERDAGVVTKAWAVIECPGCDPITVTVTRGSHQGRVPLHPRHAIRFANPIGQPSGAKEWKCRGGFAVQGEDGEPLHFEDVGEAIRFARQLWSNDNLAPAEPAVGAQALEGKRVFVFPDAPAK